NRREIGSFSGWTFVPSPAIRMAYSAQPAKGRGQKGRIISWFSPNSSWRTASPAGWHLHSRQKRPRVPIAWTNPRSSFGWLRLRLNTIRPKAFADGHESFPSLGHDVRCHRTGSLPRSPNIFDSEP